MLRARGRRSRITLEFDIDRRTNSVTVRPIRRAGDEVDHVEIIKQIARSFQKKVIDHLREKTGWSQRKIKNDVSGTLQLIPNNDSGYANAENILVKNINIETMVDLFNNKLGAGSDPHYAIHDIYWEFIPNPNTIRIGRGGKFDGDKYAGLLGWKYKWLEKHNHVGCAAKSIAYQRYKKIPNRVNMAHNINTSAHKVGKMAEEIQNEMGWGIETTIQDLSKYVEKYKDWRIVVIQSFYLRADDFRGDDYIQNEDRKKDKTFILFYDIESEHFAPCSSPEQLIRKIRGIQYRWCWKCASSYNSQKKNDTCNCGSGINYYNSREEKRKEKRVVCRDCEETYYKNNAKQHRCGATKCKFCQQYYITETSKEHRCPLYINPKKFMRRFKGEPDREGEVCEKDYELWVWDIESQMVPILDKTTDEYYTNEDGQFEKTEGPIEVYSITKCKQVPNFVAWQNVFTGEKHKSYNLQDFVKFALSNNDGNNYFLAHNSSGYDTRLLFEEINKATPSKEKPAPIFKGSKFMRLVMNGRTVFQDSMLHLMGSLASLSKAFGLKETKGYFPHLFNKAENLDYVGNIPPKDTFDLTFIAKSKSDLEDFDKWYDEQEFVVWNFKEELEKYCIQDVSLLAQIVRIYHDKLTESLSDFSHITISPWFFPTMAGYVHKIMLRHLHEGNEIESMSEEHPKEFQEYVQNTWAVLQPEEHYYAKLALRGGRTDIRQYYYKGDINYKDIQSHYPHVQLKYDYPTGTPDIEIHDKDYYPCNLCWATPDEICKHSYENRKEYVAKNRNKLVIKEIQYVNDWICNGEIRNSIHGYIKNFFGIITVDVTPNPRLYHPVLIIFDEAKKKCIATLKPITKGTFTSVELNRAIEMGYIVTKIYRADRYRRNPSIWKTRGLLGALYLNKMKNSGFAPECHEERRRMRITFASKFGIDLGNMDTWAPNKVLKKVAKGPVTAAWGKHAESVDHPQAIIFGIDEFERGSEFFELVHINKKKINQFTKIGDDRIMFKYTDSRRIQKPDLHKGYLPAAVFVTSYARLYLWEELNKLGKRVLMHDTDSIVYAKGYTNDSCRHWIYDESKEYCEDCYDIQEGDCLGDWETEDDQINNNGIVEFVAIGPKSYGLKFGNGKTTVKCKGVSLKYAHEQLFNFDVMKELLFDYTNVKLPQLSFKYVMNHGICAEKFLKKVCFNKYDVKGDYNPQDYRNYPYGYIE